MDTRPVIDKSQLLYGKLAHILAMIACMIALIAPVLILSFPHRNLLNPTLLFNTIFEGKNPADIWAFAGNVDFESTGFWKLFADNFFAPDGFAALGVIIGCSAALWALIPAFWQFFKKKEYFYVCVSLFIMSLISFAMSGLIDMAG